MMNSLIRSILVCPNFDKTYPKIRNGKGIYLFDEQGNRYIDASAGTSAVSTLGHGRQEIANLIAEQITKVAVLPTHVVSSEVVENYLTSLIQFAPTGFKKAWLATSGTEAVECAVKLALHYQYITGHPNKYKIISRKNTFHGNSIFALDIGGAEFRKLPYQKLFNNFPHLSPANNYRRPIDMDEATYVKQLVDEFEKIILAEDPNSIAAFIAEPVVSGAMGAAPPPENYFKEIYEICRKHEILFISDEVLCGFGRTGENFGINNYGVIPDIIAAGKGISGGYFPLSAILASEKIMMPFDENKIPFTNGITFACNPVGAAVGKITLDILEKEQLIKNAKKMGELFLSKLQKLLEIDIVGDVRGVGLLCGIELVSDKKTKAPFSPQLNLAKKITEIALQSGLILFPGSGTVDGINGDHLLITPPLIINELQLDEIMIILAKSIREVASTL